MPAHVRPTRHDHGASAWATIVYRSSKKLVEQAGLAAQLHKSPTTSSTGVLPLRMMSTASPTRAQGRVLGRAQTVRRFAWEELHMKLSSAKFQPSHNTTYSPLRRMLGVLSVLALALVIAPVSAHASLLLPGTTVFPDPLLPPTGTTLASTSGPFSTATLSGTYSESVIAATNNTLCSGCLDFVINVSNNVLSRDSIETISTGSFGLFLTDVGFNIASTGVVPLVVDRSTTGDVINFAYFQPNVIHPGQSSAELIIETNATHFTAGTISLIDQFTATVTGFAPTVPEPASMALLGAGFLAFAAALRSKK